MYMSETKYLISEMSKMLQLEPHVLRYWEEELGFDIGRNDMGHRYYTDKDLQRFLRVKELKKDGMQLREIKEKLVEKDTKIVDFCGKDSKKISEESPFEQLSSKENAFFEIMERMIAQIEQSDKKEARYRRLDEAIRHHQQSRKMVAATQEVEKRSRKKSKGKNKGDVKKRP